MIPNSLSEGLTALPIVGVALGPAACKAVEGEPVSQGLVAPELSCRLALSAGRTALGLHAHPDYSAWSLASLLHILTNELLAVLLEHLVDLVQEGVDVLGHFLVAFGDLGVDRGLDLVGLLARARRLLLSAGVPGGHGLPSGSTELLLP